ncbi:MAG: iron ABC transporter permease [Pseudomonadota bacterium]
MNAKAPGSLRYRQRRRLHWLAIGGATLALCALFLVDVGTGPGQLSMARIADVLRDSSSHGAAARIIVWDIRLPVASMAVLVGAMLSIAGAQMQSILNNPLADPFTLGISSAAAFGAALAITLGAEQLALPGDLAVTLGAFGFSLLTTVLLYGFTRLRGASAETMVLIGIALLFTFNALLSLLQYTATDAQVSQIVFWMMGSLAKADWQKVGLCALVLAICLPLFLLRGRALTAMRLGDARAASLGVDVARLRVEILLAVSLLAATAVAFVGTVAFVGLVGPHIARLIVGEDQRLFLPASLLCGALIMSATSILSKTISPGVVYPVGIITSLVGIPFFVSLILGRQRRNWQ